MRSFFRGSAKVWQRERKKKRTRESVTARESAVGRGREKERILFFFLSRPPTLALPRKKERLIAGYFLKKKLN